MPEPLLAPKAKVNPMAPSLANQPSVGPSLAKQPSVGPSLPKQPSMGPKAAILAAIRQKQPMPSQAPMTAEEQDSGAEAEWYAKASSDSAASSSQQIPPWRQAPSEGQGSAAATEASQGGWERSDERWRPRPGHEQGGRYGNRGGKHNVWYSARAKAKAGGPATLREFLKKHPKPS